MNQQGDENWADIRTEMGHSMEAGCGIYRREDLMEETIAKLAELKARYKNISIKDKGKVFNTDLLYAIEVGYGLEVAEAMAHSAILRVNHVVLTNVWMKAVPSVTIRTS